MGVKFEHVTKMYTSGRPAVNDLSFEVQSGELLVLIGPSGCGKTTTLRMINRLEEPTSGTISIDGRDIHRYDPIQLRRGIGYTIQQTGLLPHMTVEQNIELVPRLLKWDKPRRRERTRELLAMVDMEYDTFAHRYPRQLSGGQQQRIGVLRALAIDPPVILMDEPFGALDPISREVLQTELKRLQARLRKTIVFVTHDIDEAMRLGDRVAILRDGQLLQVDAPETLLRAPQDDFVAKFLGRYFAMRRSPVSSVRQIMQMDTLEPYRELPDGDRIVRVVGIQCWCWLDQQGVLKGTTHEQPANNERNTGIWVSGNADAVKESEPPAQALRRLADGEIEVLPVVDELHRLVGIVTARSAIKVLSSVAEGDEA